jgi:hypothetical protein
VRDANYRPGSHWNSNREGVANYLELEVLVEGKT